MGVEECQELTFGCVGWRSEAEQAEGSKIPNLVRLEVRGSLW